MMDITNLAYGVDYSILQNYYNGGINTQITIPAGEHKLLFESLNAPLLCTDSQGIAWARTPVILFDFNVSNGGNVTLSSLAAYNRENLILKTGEKNILEYNNSEIDTGEIIYGLDIQGNPAWENHIDNPRPNESDLYAKYKGIAINQSAWIDSKLEFLIDDTIASGKQLELYLKDDYYSNGIANPKLKWLTNLNPLNDEFEGSLYALPGHKHTFTYHRDKGGIWNFAFNYKNLKDEILENAGDDEIINIPVSEEIITKAKENVSLGWKKNFAGSAPEPRSISMGAYGVTYHYTITITNKGTTDRSISPSFTKFENMSFGYKQEGEALYSVQYNSGASYKNEQNWWKPVNISIPANSTITFEIVYLIAAGQGGTHNSIIVN